MVDIYKGYELKPKGGYWTLNKLKSDDDIKKFLNKNIKTKKDIIDLIKKNNLLQNNEIQNNEIQNNEIQNNEIQNNYKNISTNLLIISEYKKYFKISQKINKIVDIKNFINENNIKLFYKFDDNKKILNIITKNNNEIFRTTTINILNCNASKFLIHLISEEFDLMIINFGNTNYKYKDLLNRLFPPDPRKECKNDTTLISGELLIELDINKFIKLNGYGYDCDEILEYLINIKCKNINPYNKFIKIYSDSWELNKLLSHKNLNKSLLNEYNDIIEKINIEKKLIPLKLIKNLKSKNLGIDVEFDEIFNIIGEFGFKMLNDNINSWSEDSNVFNESIKLIEILREKINNNDFYYDLYYYDSNIKDILDTAHTTCIHGVGYSLMKIYMYWISEIYKFLNNPIKISDDLKEKYKNILELVDYNNYYNLCINNNYVFINNYIISCGITEYKLLIKSYDTINNKFESCEYNKNNFYCNDNNLKKILNKNNLFTKYINKNNLLINFINYKLFIIPENYDFDVKIFKLITKNNFEYINNNILTIIINDINNILKIECFDNKNLLYKITN